MTPFAWTAATTTALVAGWLVTTAPRVSPPPPPPPSPELMTPAAAAARVEREVVEPMRERTLGMRFFSRAGPTVDEKTLHAILSTEVAPTDAYVHFRVEVESLRAGHGPETAWLGRVDRKSGAVELALPLRNPEKVPKWRPAAEALPSRAK